MSVGGGGGRGECSFYACLSRSTIDMLQGSWAQHQPLRLVLLHVAIKNKEKGFQCFDGSGEGGGVEG